ncbi:MAG: sigma-54 dependent transcriptional regulator [Cytophagaceae bacterium]|nr:sigma-54 dependent transcriptional regulator [Cytophagaceae bacterium]
MDIQQIKQRFGIIGNSNALNRAIDIAVQVAPTDLSVLITGESGTGKEVFPQIIHQFSARKHGRYIAVNCGAIPEGTVDSELFGHEKGSFTGALADRKGYFEESNGGTIFLDEIGELPLATQARLLRVLETGEFIRVGSSKSIKTNVRVVGATNVNLDKAIKDGKFREDLFYRLNSVPVNIPPLRERAGDIHLLFRKFAGDFANKYRMPPIKLDESAQNLLEKYRWPGNVRQLKNIAEQISIVESQRLLTGENLKQYLPSNAGSNLPALVGSDSYGDANYANEREILYKVLFDMKRDMTDLKKLVLDIVKSDENMNFQGEHAQIIRNLYNEEGEILQPSSTQVTPITITPRRIEHEIEDTEEFVEESLLIEEMEKEFIEKALKKHGGRRKNAAKELGISERTLYRKIKEYGMEE